MKAIVTLGDYLFLIWWSFLGILSFWKFVKTYEAGGEKNKGNQNLIYTKNDLPPENSDKQEKK